MKNILSSLRLFITLSVITGIIYPLVVLGYARVFFSGKAEGGIVSAGGRPVGAELIAQAFTRSGYFHPRPSAVDYNTLASGGSNQSPTSAALLAAVKERRAAYAPGAAPADMLFASGSGLDPHISQEAARAQCARVAKARGVAEFNIMSLIEAATEGRQAEFLGEPRVNVLRLNLALDGKYPI
jgi:K+-transporting ATPase ATPase C chain